AAGAAGTLSRAAAKAGRESDRTLVHSRPSPPTPPPSLGEGRTKQPMKNRSAYSSAAASRLAAPFALSVRPRHQLELPLRVVRRLRTRRPLEPGADRPQHLAGEAAAILGGERL